MLKVWTDEDNEALQVYFDNDYTDIEIADAMGRTPASISKRRAQLRMKRPPLNPWTEEQIAMLYEPENMTLPSRTLAKKLGKHATTVRTKRAELGLQTCVYRRWTREEIETLFEHHEKGAAYIGRLLDRTTRAVCSKAAELELPIRRKVARGVANVS